jgi:dienelactone hydrolase
MTMTRQKWPGFAILCVLACTSSPAWGETLTLPFTLSKPGGDGPFPAVVILHDCSGLGPQSGGAPRRWALELSLQGYVTIMPDSFAPRGRPHGVCTESSGPRVTFEERQKDAYAALSYLQSLSFVDPRRIAVMGGSHGGSSTLATIVETPEHLARGGNGFAAAVALYPGCGRTFGGWSVTRANQQRGPITGYAGAFKPLAPLLILTGELDDWTPAEPCRKLTEAARAAGHPVELKVYPGAHHSFDSNAPTRFVAERINSNAPSGRGATTGGNAEAWADAKERVREFLGAHLAAGKPGAAKP